MSQVLIGVNFHVIEQKIQPGGIIRVLVFNVTLSKDEKHIQRNYTHK